MQSQLNTKAKGAARWGVWSASHQNSKRILMKKTLTSAAASAGVALALAFSPVLFAQNTSGPDQSQNSRGTDSTADQHAGATGTSTASSTMDKNNSKDAASQTIDPNVNQNKTGSDMTAATKTPSDATTSPVDQTRSNEALSQSTASNKAEKPLSDKEFVMKASQGGMTEVQLGKLASDKGGSSQVKDFGSQMVKDHSQANDELKSLADKKGFAVSPNLDSKDQAQVDKLSKLSGPAFDKAYVTNQVRAHESTVKLFQEEAKSGQDPDLKAFASRTLPTLQEHCSAIMNIENKGAK
jgi:putative membrane protein